MYHPGDISPMGTYDVGPAPVFPFGGFNCSDHSGGGNMMLVAPASFDCTTDTIALFAADIAPANAVVSRTATAGGQIAGRTDTVFAFITAPGIYTLIVTNPLSGCNALATDTIGQNIASPFALIQKPDIITCQQPGITLFADSSSVGSQFTYNWSTATGNIIGGGSTLNPLVNAPGTYSLLVTDTLNGCTATAAVSVVMDADLDQAGWVPNRYRNRPNTLCQRAGCLYAVDFQYPKRLHCQYSSFSACI